VLSVASSNRFVTRTKDALIRLDKSKEMSKELPCGKQVEKAESQSRLGSILLRVGPLVGFVAGAWPLTGR